MLRITSFYFLLIFLFMYKSNFSQRFEKDFALYNNVLSVLNDSQKTIVGINMQLNNFLWLDGTVMQTALRYKLVNNSTEIGGNINLYRNKSFYAKYVYYWDDTTKDRAIDGYSIRASINHKITKNNTEIQFGLSPHIYIHDQTPTTTQNKLYDFGGTAAISFTFKKFEFWSSYSFRPETEYEIDRCDLTYCNPTHFYLDSNHIYHFETKMKKVLNANFSRVFNIGKINTIMPYFGVKSINIYGSRIAVGVTLQRRKFILTPEIKLWSWNPKASGKGGKLIFGLSHYGLLMKYPLWEEIDITLSYIYIKSYYIPNIEQQYQTNIGLQYNF